jgi:hypothetical protein
MRFSQLIKSLVGNCRLQAAEENEVALKGQQLCLDSFETIGYTLSYEADLATQTGSDSRTTHGVA